ncbi:MAG: lipase family protein [Lentisphaeria bacterium]|nr:lipase family protein [Lentisphaeria bacterium]NQZ67487.1 lipase family protein [Lentisphaeria bacterium]
MKYYRSYKSVFRCASLAALPLPETDTEDSYKLALKSAIMSHLAYMDKQVIEDYLPSNHQLTASIQEESTQAIIVKDLDTGQEFLSFRGTCSKDFGDLKIDSQVLFTKHPNGGDVHTGFYKAFKRVEAQIKTSLEGKPVCSGHSLGAALAVLFAAENNIMDIHCIGCPRVGNQKFVDGLSFVAKRFDFACDIVPSLPPAIGYKHGGDQYYISHLGEIHLNPSSKLIIADRVNAEIEFALGHRLKPTESIIRGLVDHSILNYCEQLKAICEAD